MTGRVLAILKQHAQWQTVDDLHKLYQSLLTMGFDPDEMSYEDLAQTCHNLVPYSILGTTVGYVWHVFHQVFNQPIEGENNESN
jgi:hypothetical protein